MTKQKNRSRNLLQYKLFPEIIFTSTGLFYVASLVYIFFFARRRWGAQPKRNINFLLFREKILYWQTTGAHTRPESIEFYKDLIGNILLFIPFPFLLFYFFGVKRFSRQLAIAIATSFIIETIQFLFNIGVADIDDLLLNTIGTMVGSLMLYAVFFKNKNTYRLSNTWKTADEL